MNSNKILVADDEAMIADLCRRVLTKQGYEVKCAKSGEEAMRLVSEESFQLVILDMVMSGMNGLDVFLGIRERQSEIIGVLMTGHGTMDTAIQAMQHGFSGFIKKPFAVAELIQVVEDAIYKAALMEENSRLKTLIPLYRMSEKFITSQTKNEVLNELIETVSQQTGAQRITVILYDKKEKCLRITAAKGVHQDIIQKVRIKSGEKIAGWVFQTGEPVILNGGPENNPKFASFMKSKNIVAAISFPLKWRNEILGVINVSKVRKGTPFSQADIEMLSVVCGQAIMALDNLKIMAERAETVRVRTLLEQYMTPEVAEVLISHGQNPMDVGEIKDITVLFSDIRNFTPLVQHVPLETLRSFLNDFFDLLTEAVFRFKGTLDKFMGDATLAIFGAPIPLDQPNRAAVFSAIEMMKRFEELKKMWWATEKSFDQVGLGIGIASGEMFLGNVGSQKRFDYTVIGTDVNLAQRLASEAASGEILISKSVRDHLDGQFHVTQELSRQLKGLEKPVPIFTIGK